MLLYDIYQDAINVAMNIEESIFLGEPACRDLLIDRYQWLQDEAKRRGAELQDWRELLEDIQQ